MLLDSEVCGPFKTLRMVTRLSDLLQYTEKQLPRKHWRCYFLRSVHLFGWVSWTPASIWGMLPMFWSGYCGGFSWWASVVQGQQPRLVQGLLPLVCAVKLSRDAPRFSLRVESRALLIHKLNQKNRNYVALEIESYAELSCEGAFPTSGFTV